MGMANEPNRATQTVFVETFDAAGIDKLAEHLPNENCRHRYRLRNPAAAHSPSQLLCRHALRAAGDLQVSWVTERLGTQVRIVEPGIPAYCFSTIRAGEMALTLPEWQDTARGTLDFGLIHQGQSGTSALTLDGTTRTNLWISSERLEAALAASLGAAPLRPVVFRPEIDWRTPAGGAVQRLLEHAAAEFESAAGLASEPIGLSAFSDLFAHTVLNSLPHNYRERLLNRTASVGPRHLRRAEAFMHAEAARPIQLADIAAAAGCSARSLQNAFRNFRETTPHKALQRIRLELAEADLRLNRETVTTVARRYGFSHPGRFSKLYAQRYGRSPAELPNDGTIASKQVAPHRRRHL